MPILRNPFSRRVPDDIVIDENGRSVLSDRGEAPRKTTRPRPGPLDIRSNGDQTPTEYKLSEINDSGVFLPPSPTEKPKFFSSRSQSSTTSSSQRSAFTESDNPFTISRESFDCYRRSFDISARSPVLTAEPLHARHSLDTRRFRMPLPALRDNQINPPESQPEERFEDIGLNDELEAAKPKRTGIFSRFSHSAHDSPFVAAQPDSARPSSSHFSTPLFGRKRAASGQEAELGSISKGQETGKPQEGKKV